MKDDFIGKRLEQYYHWNSSDNFKSPTLELEKIMSEISDDLGRYMNNNPNVKQGYVAKQQAIISRLFDIVEQLKDVEPLDVWVRINERIRQASAVGQADYIKMLLPLKPDIKKINLMNQPNPTQALIDFVWNGKLSETECMMV